MLAQSGLIIWCFVLAGKGTGRFEEERRGKERRKKNLGLRMYRWTLGACSVSGVDGMLNTEVRVVLREKGVNIERIMDEFSK